MASFDDVLLAISVADADELRTLLKNPALKKEAIEYAKGGISGNPNFNGLLNDALERGTVDRPIEERIAVLKVLLEVDGIKQNALKNLDDVLHVGLNYGFREHEHLVEFANLLLQNKEILNIIVAHDDLYNKFHHKVDVSGTPEQRVQLEKALREHTQNKMHGEKVKEKVQPEVVQQKKKGLLHQAKEAIKPKEHSAKPKHEVVKEVKRDNKHQKKK